MEAWCDHCEMEQRIVRTVAWQPNFCAECGLNVADGHVALELNSQTVLGLEEWCTYCSEERELVRTVTWQANLCTECGNSVA